MTRNTLTISALPLPQEANSAYRALLIKGNVIVMRSGGGLGESLMKAIIRSFSWKVAMDIG